MPSIYLDWNATAPLHASVIETMLQAMREGWGNPASVHRMGRAARKYVEEARQLLAERFLVDARDLYFTSGGTEANNWAIRSLLDVARPGIAASRMEHPSVYKPIEKMERAGEVRAHWIASEASGLIDLQSLQDALRTKKIGLVVLQAVNHETGVIQPVSEAIALCKQFGARVHIDAVQAFGKIENLGAGADGRAIAGHKIRGPKGIGVWITQPGAVVCPLLYGGGQERGLRPGTVDPIAAAGLAEAVRRAVPSVERDQRIKKMRDRLEKELLSLWPGAEVNGTADRVAHVTNISFPKWNGAELVVALDLESVCVSSGSACSAGTIASSSGIAAMVGEERAKSSLRISMGESTTEEEIDGAIEAFRKVFYRASASLT